MDAFKSTLMHTLELIVCLGGSWLVLHFFGVNDEMKATVLGIVVSGLSKFARASDSVPIGDFVNQV